MRDGLGGRGKGWEGVELGLRGFVLGVVVVVLVVVLVPMPDRQVGSVVVWASLWVFMMSRCTSKISDLVWFGSVVERW